MNQAALIYSPALLKYTFQPTHPFHPRRLEATQDLILALNLSSSDHIRTPRMATNDELALFHTDFYIDLVTRLSDTGRSTYGAQRWGLGTEDNPVFLGMHQAAALAVGATLTAAELVLEDHSQRVFAISGGLHHAGADHASGFCIYNDIVVAIRFLQRKTHWRILYVETDAHHGDGVQDAFYEDPNVFVLSFHESGEYLFPGTGQVDDRGRGPGIGTTLNVPLYPTTDDDSWLKLYEAIVPRVIQFFKPDLIISQHGCDGHYWDPLADLCATTTFYRLAPALLDEWIQRYTAGRWIATGGGGYQTLSVVPRAWTLLWSTVSQQSLPVDCPIPQDWLLKWQKPSEKPLPSQLLDTPDQFRPIRDLHRMQSNNDKTLAAIRAHFPNVGI